MPLADQTELGRAARRTFDGHAAAPLVRRRSSSHDASSALEAQNSPQNNRPSGARQAAICPPSLCPPSFESGNGWPQNAQAVGDGNERELLMAKLPLARRRGSPHPTSSCGWGWALSPHSGSIPSGMIATQAACGPPCRGTSTSNFRTRKIDRLPECTTLSRITLSLEIQVFAQFVS